MGRVSNSPFSVDVLVVGGGPAGSAAAIHAAKAGYSVLLIDAQPFPRDKTCGDGLTPRAVHQLEALGVNVTSRYRSFGLKLHGFGGSVTVPWPESHFGQVSSAMPRMEFDAMLWEMAAQHATTWTATASEVEIDSAIRGVTMSDGRVVKPRSVIVADGVRSTFGKLLGRTWHRGEVYGIAARSYCTTPRSTEPWMHSHLELRDDSTTLPGYGWIFPLGDGTANVGCGALSTDKRPAKINTKKLLRHYASQQTDWEFGTPQRVASALLPMGGAVSTIAGPNWMLIGDAAACVNPLNGEGIDYGLETAALAVAHLDNPLEWPHILRETYGEAFLLARTAARLLTYPQFLPLTGPIALRTPLMASAARLMGNLVTEEDKDIVARAWRAAGWGVTKIRGGSPLWD
ncbi:geranylgeranyl reductase family protein [Corynebacterium belfantii]|uniref:geranylgeranyl reductase family protein n=1 Tax=Corynebacterium belfantii TaxID=2014537 RepID=UPI000B4BBC06|nr:geranylgeranyl reductase family protein [Corynebacterium belfantii]MBG9324974.1 geranylgeranyl reductase family protein [Corynebacterium belfantii]OWM39957.1 FAD-linked oxidoreductase [Corynebacterium diphtheriae subsp. lausannense]SNW32469.1 Putative oxidoreductasec/MT0587 [Corynebacterium belfantii]